MLKGIPGIIPPELLKILSEMGHGDEICIGDANFPGQALSDRVIRMDGHGVPEILDAVLTLIPLDQYVEHPAALMQVVPGDNTPTPIRDTYRSILASHESRGADCLEEVERFAFYDRVHEKSYCVIMSGEKATYANIILKKGVI
ncbi:MAG: fucose isomerase [Clostridia bacterium]|nr:fucose isomerase [Clostridia bacterium]